MIPVSLGERIRMKGLASLLFMLLIVLPLFVTLPTHASPAYLSPWLQVSPSTVTAGPAPCVGSMIFVSVDVHNLTRILDTVAVGFRLQYNYSVLEFVDVTEGPFLKDPAWNLYGTFFDYLNTTGDVTYPFPHVRVGNILFPNTTSGVWDQVTLPNTLENSVDPTLATFQFRVLQQNGILQPDITTELNILPDTPPDLYFVNTTGNVVAPLPGVNGTATVFSLRGLGDVNNDGQVQLEDVGLVGQAFGTSPGDARWNACADVSGDGVVDLMDVATTSSKFGQSYP
jgi:hypothetical protein